MLQLLLTLALWLSHGAIPMDVGGGPAMQASDVGGGPAHKTTVAQPMDVGGGPAPADVGGGPALH